jgi:predicted PurR-regulated permease PerM
VRAAASWSWRLLVIGLLVAAVAWIVTFLKVIVVPVAVAALLTVLLMPVQRLLMRWLRFGRALASATSLLGLVALVAGLAVIAGRSIAGGFQQLQTQATDGIDTFMQWLSDGPLQLDATTLDNWTNTFMESLRANESRLISGAIGAATTVSHVAAGTLIALFCTFFFLLDGRGVWSWLVRLLPVRSRESVHQAGRRGLVTIGAYVRTQILVAGVDAIGIGIGAAVLRVPLALPLAILVFIGSFVPIVGALVTGAVAVLVALVANGWVSALVMLGVVIAVQQIEGHVLQPLLMGHAVSLHPVAVFLAVAAGSFTAGIVGALFAVPLAAAVNTVLLYFHGHDKFPELGTDDRLQQGQS